MKNCPSLPASPLAAVEPSPRWRTTWAGTGLSSQLGSPCRCTGHVGPAVTTPRTPVLPAATARVVEVVGATVVVGGTDPERPVVVEREPGETEAVPAVPPETDADAEVDVASAGAVVALPEFVAAATCPAGEWPHDETAT